MIETHASETAMLISSFLAFNYVDLTMNPTVTWIAAFLNIIIILLSGRYYTHIDVLKVVDAVDQTLGPLS